MRKKSPLPALNPTLAALMGKPAQPDHQMAYVCATIGRFFQRGVASAPHDQLDRWEARPNGVVVEGRFGLVKEESRLRDCRGLNSGVSLPEAVRRAYKKPRTVSPHLADLCRAAHQDPEELLRA